MRAPAFECVPDRPILAGRGVRITPPGSLVDHGPFLIRAIVFRLAE